MSAPSCNHDRTDPANIFTNAKGHRKCLPCRRISNTRARAKSRAVTLPRPRRAQAIPPAKTGHLDRQDVAACADHVELWDRETPDVRAQARVCSGCPLARICPNLVSS